MMKVIEVAFAGYPVTDLKRARRFYEGTLGLTASRIFGDETTAFIEYDIGPTTISIGNGAPDWKPSSHGGAIALEVENFNEAMDALKKDNVKLTMGPMETPVCHMAVVLDPDGNSLLIHKRKG